MNCTRSQISGFECWNKNHNYGHSLWLAMAMIKTVVMIVIAIVMIVISRQCNDGDGWIVEMMIMTLLSNQWTPLWLAVASTRKIFSTRSCCSHRAISNKSTCNNKHSVLDKFQLNMFLQKMNFVFEKSERVLCLKSKEHEDEQLSRFSESFARETMSAWAVDKAEQWTSKI